MTDCLLAANHSKLRKDMGEVVFDGLLADVEAEANFPIAHPLS